MVGDYQDDGRTGTDSDREDFQRLLSDIYAKKINCVIVKDLPGCPEMTMSAVTIWNMCSFLWMFVLSP